jgi:hypothetical protein
MWKRILAGLLALGVAMPLALVAQPPAPARSFAPEELEQLAAPIALYPDPLLAQVLMASTYPLEVVLAERFLQANPGLTGDTLSQALQAQSWDDSVKSLVTFPQVLKMMSDRLDWTQKLGDAFLAQPQDLMDAVQRLRARAQAQGTLVTTPQQIVTVAPAPAPPIIEIAPATPGVIYVPMYNPLVVYGPWPYAAYPPYYWYPPGWVAGAFFTFGASIVVGVALWSVLDWHRHVIEIDVGRYQRFTRVVNVERRWGGLERGRPAPGDGRLGWEHEPRHRQGVDYRDESTQQRFGRPRAPGAPAREPFRGWIQEPFAPGRGAAPLRQGVPPQPPAGVGRAVPGPPRPPAPALQPQGPGAFQGLGRGPDVRSYSDRGRESRQRIAPPPRAPSRPAPPRPAPGGGGARGGRR